MAVIIYETIFDDATIKTARKQSAGTQQPNVEWEGTMENFRVIKPPSAIIEKFSEKVNPVLMTCQIKFDDAN